MTRTWGLATLALAFACTTFAQFETSEVVGTVRDASNSAVQNAAVTLTNEDTGIQAKTTSDSDGDYDFFNVRVGRYTITAEANGFSKYVTSEVKVSVNARQRVDISMQVGAVTQSVEVSDAAAVLETDTSEHSQVIHTEQVVELPLNGRNFSDLALLATNVHRSPFGAAAPPREGSFNANGLRSTYNNFLLDGLDNNAYSTSNQGFSNQVAQPSPDSIAEFRVITSNFSAEYGRVGGAIVNSVMRSGTNGFHGTAYDFLRNTDLNAVGMVFARPRVFEKPTLQRNQFGLTIGGPIIQNRVFFFGDYEGFRQLQRSLNFDTLPTAGDRAFTLPQDVVNPLTGTLYPKNTPIPVSAVNPVARAILSQLPPPSFNGARANDYETLQLVRDYSDKYDAKIDGQINEKMTAFLRFSQKKDNLFYQPDLPGYVGGNGNGNVRILDQAAGGGYTWTVTPTSLLEVRMGFTRILGGKFPVLLGGPGAQQLFGITGLPTDPSIVGGLNTQNIGGGFSTLGRQATNPQFQNPTTWDPRINYSLQKGKHSIKLGYEWEAINTEVMDINPVYGLMAYSGQFSKPSASSPADTATYDYADFLFGLPSQLQLANYLVTNYRQHQHFLYVQDDFRVSSKLTLNLGLRWEFATPRWEKDNNLTNFDPTTNQMLQAKSGDLYSRTLVHPDYLDFGPRAGLAYSFTSKTVLRAGYGISYVHLNRLGSADELGINAPQVNIATLNQSPTAGGKVNPAFVTTQSGFPAGFDSTTNINYANTNVAYIPADTRWPYVQTWTFGLQQEIARQTVLEVSYNGNHSSRLPIVADYNQAYPNTNPSNLLGIQARRPISTFGAITWVDPAGIATYNALSLRFEHRFSSGLYFLNSFTWSKALTDSEQELEDLSGQTVANPQNIRNLAQEKGPSSLDVTLANVTSVVYQLPFGKGRKFGSSWNAVTDGVLGGWEINTINSVNTGQPVTIQYTPNATQDVTGRINDFRGLAVMRPNLVGDPTGASGPTKVDHYFNAAAFAIPSAIAPFGNLGRNALRGPGFSQWDVSVDKSFRLPFREGTALQFRSEFFNVLNHTNLFPPDGNISNATFGQIRSTFPARQIQFALKLLF